MSEVKSTPEACATQPVPPVATEAVGTAPKKAPIITDEERRLMEEVHRKFAALPSPLSPWLGEFVILADHKLTHPLTDADAYRYIQFGQRFLRELRRLGLDVPELLAVPKVPGLTYDGAIESFLKVLQWAAAQRGAKLMTTEDGSIVLLVDGIANGQSARRRVLLGVQGNGSEPELASALRAFLVAGRREPTTRPALLTDLGDIDQKIRGLAAEVHAAIAAAKNGKAKETERLLKDPDALRQAERDLSPWAPTVQAVVLVLEQHLPRIEDAVDRLHRSIDGRRLPNVPESWGRPIQVLVMGLDFVFNAVLRHATTVAPDDVLDQLTRLLTAPAPKATSSAAASSDDELPIPATGEEFEEGEESGEGSSEALPPEQSAG